MHRFIFVDRSYKHNNNNNEIEYKEYWGKTHLGSKGIYKLQTFLIFWLHKNVECVCDNTKKYL